MSRGQQKSTPHESYTKPRVLIATPLKLERLSFDSYNLLFCQQDLPTYTYVRTRQRLRFCYGYQRNYISAISQRLVIFILAFNLN